MMLLRKRRDASANRWKGPAKIYGDELCLRECDRSLGMKGVNS